MRGPALASLFLLALLSGCAGETSNEAGMEERSSGPTGSSTSPEPSPSTPPGTTSPAPSPSASSNPPSPDPGANPPPAGPETTRFDGKQTATVRLAQDVAIQADTYKFALDASGVGLVIEMVWDPSTPASSTMGLELHRLETSVGGSEGANTMTPVGEVAGPGPLRLALPALAPGEYTVIVRASGPDDTAGAAVEQGFTLWVTLFKDVPFDAAYTAPR